MSRRSCLVSPRQKELKCILTTDKQFVANLVECALDDLAKVWAKYFSEDRNDK